MNEKLNLVEILKDCPNGTKLYTPVWGEVIFERILYGKIYTIRINTVSGYYQLTKEGCYTKSDDAECILFPSKDQRDWSKFTAPWYKRDRFDPKTLKPFDKVLARDTYYSNWRGTLFSHYIKKDGALYSCVTVGEVFNVCIPYNEDTKHLVGTTEEAPEYYRYWED